MNIVAIKLTDENIETIIAQAKDEDFDLSYLPDNMQYYAEDFGEELYLVKSVSINKNDYTITYADMTKTSFDELWKFEGTENPNGFTRIARR